MFGFQACVLCLTALALVDFIFVSFRSSLTVDRNGTLTMLTIMIIHELIVVVQMGLVMRLVMLTYWFQAGLFCACAKVLTVVAPVWVLRLFFTCFPCVYRIYFVPGHSANQVCDAAQNCVLRSTRRPWHDGGYGALVVLDLIVALVNALAVLHLLSFLSEKSLYPPYDHVLRTTRKWKSLDPTNLWTASGDAQESIETAPMASSAPDTSARPLRGSSSSSVVAPNVAAMAPGVSQSTALTASTDTHVHGTRISWQRRATEELSARNAWRAMFLSDMLEPERPTLTEAEQPPSRRDRTDHDENRHVPVALDTDTPDVRQESTSVFRPNHEERLCVPLSSRSSDDDGSADNNADRSHRSDSTVQRASAHTRGPSLGRPESVRRVSSPFTPTPAPSLSRTPPSTTRTRLGPVASTAAPTNAVDSTAPSTANTPSWEVETRGNPFFTYDVSGYRSSGHPHRRQSSHVMSALLPASSEHMTGTGPTTTRTRTSSSSATSGAVWLRQASSLDSGVGARPFLPALDVKEAQHTRRTGQGDGEEGLGLKRFFAYHRHSRRRSSSAANLTVSRSDQHAVATSRTRTAPPSSSSALAFAFPTSLSYQQQQQTQMQPQHGRQAENADPRRVSLSPSERPGTARPRAVSSTASGAAADELRVPGRGGEAEMISSRKDHSSLLFHDDPFMLELHSGVVSAMRDGAQASSTTSFLHTIGASAGTTRTAPSARLLSGRDAAGQQLVRSTTIPPSESGDDVGKEVGFPRTTMPPLPRPPPSS